MCSCIEEMDALLSPENGRVQVTINMRDGTASPLIGVRKLNPRGKTPPLAIPSHCPFCGESLISRKVQEAPDIGPRPRPSAILGRLNGEQRRQICLAAIVQALGREGERNMLAPITGYSAAEMHGSDAIREVLEDALPELFEGGRVPLPDLSEIGTQSCPLCGCTDDLACGDRCGWSNEEVDGRKICTSCSAARQSGAPPSLQTDGA